MVLNDRENISQIKIGMNSTASDSVTIQIHVVVEALKLEALKNSKSPLGRIKFAPIQ